jgi:hypothetical protein
VKVVAGVDLGGTAVNYTIVNAQEQFLIEGLCEHPALSTQGPDVCLRQIEDGLKIAVEKTGVRLDDVVAVGLDTPGPASSSGVLSARGSTNFVHADWAGFDIRTKLEARLGPARHLPQRWQRRSPLGTLHHLWRAEPCDVDLRLDWHRSRRRRHRRWQCSQGQVGIRRRTRPRPHSLSKHRRHRRPEAGMQLRPNRHRAAPVSRVAGCQGILRGVAAKWLITVEIHFRITCTRSEGWAGAPLDFR